MYDQNSQKHYVDEKSVSGFDWSPSFTGRNGSLTYKNRRRLTMKRFSGCSIFVTALFVLMYHLVTQTPAVFAADSTVLRYAGSFPINHHCTRGQELFAKLVMRFE